MTTGSVAVGDLTAYLAEPEGGSDTVMLLLPMINGIDGQVREYAAHVAASGATALVWDPWHGPSSPGPANPRAARTALTSGAETPALVSASGYPPP